MTNTIKLFIILLFALSLIGCNSASRSPTAEDYYTGCIKKDNLSNCQSYLIATTFDDEALQKIEPSNLLSIVSARKEASLKLNGLQMSQAHSIKAYKNSLNTNTNTSTNVNLETAKR